MTSADYVIAKVKGIKEVFNNGAKVSISEYANLPIFDIRETNEWNEIFTSNESLSGTKELAELETPPVVALEEGFSVTLSPSKYGSALSISQTMVEQSKDNTTKVDMYLSEQTAQFVTEAADFFIKKTFEMLNNGFDSSADTLAPDGVQLFGTHSWATTGASTWLNATADAFSESAVDDALEYAGAFTDAEGKPLIIDFDTIIVKKGSAAEREAKKLFAFGINPTAVNDINIYEGAMTIIATPYITAANKLNWFLMDTSKGRSCLYVGVHRYPMMHEPIVQNNQSIRTNITAYYKTGISNLPMFLYGGKGAAL